MHCTPCIKVKRTSRTRKLVRKETLGLLRDAPLNIAENRLISKKFTFA